MSLRTAIARHLAAALFPAACCFLSACSPASVPLGAAAGPEPDPSRGSAASGAVDAKPRDLCVRGRAGQDGESLEGDTVRFQVFPDGCISSGSVEKLETSCKVASVAQSQLTLESRFRYAPANAGGPPGLADCNGGGWAECAAGPLPPGDYTATLGELSVQFTIPSQVSHGGECARPR